MSQPMPLPPARVVSVPLMTLTRNLLVLSWSVRHGPGAPATDSPSPPRKGNGNR